MKKTTMFLAVVAMISCGAAARAQDAPGNRMIAISGLNLQDMRTDLTITAPGLNLQIGAPVKDDLLAGTEKFAQGASKVTEINLNPSTIGMVGKAYGPDGEMTKKMKLMVVHTYAYDKPGLFRMDDVETYVKKLEDGSWTCPVISREKEKDQEKLSYICAKTDSDQTNEMVVISAEPRELTFIHMAGTMSLNDLTHMSDSAHGLTREVTPRRAIDPLELMQQEQLQALRRLSKPTTPATPATPPVSPVQ